MFHSQVNKKQERFVSDSASFKLRPHLILGSQTVFIFHIHTTNVGNLSSYNPWLDTQLNLLLR